MGKDCTTRILFLCVVNSEGMAGYCSTKKVLYDLYKAIPFLAALCFYGYYYRNCFSHSTSLTSPHWFWDGFGFLLIGSWLSLWFLLDPLSWSLWSVTQQWALAKNSLYPQGINLHYWMYNPSKRPQTCSLAFIVCVERVWGRHYVYKWKSKCCDFNFRFVFMFYRFLLFFFFAFVVFYYIVFYVCIFR